MSEDDYYRAVRIVAAMRVNAEIATNPRERRERNAKAMLVCGAFITLFSEGKRGKQFNPLQFRSDVEAYTVADMAQRKSN